MDSMELAYELTRLLMLYFLGILAGYQIRIKEMIDIENY